MTSRLGGVALVVGLLAGFVVTGCGADEVDESAGSARVVAAFYPLAWVAEQVGGGRVDVANLTAAGAEPHDLELRPSQVAAVGDADLVIVLGGGFQPSVEAAVADRADGTLVALEALQGVAGGTGSGDVGELDPHVWLDPVIMGDLVDEVAAALSAVDRDHTAGYRANAERVRAALVDLDREFAAGLADCERRELFTAHDAFGWLARRYDLEQHGVAGITPDQEPTPERLAELSALVNETGATTVFVETLVSAEVAETLANEAGGLAVATLDPLEGLDDSGGGDADYLTVMRDNLAALRLGLTCT